MELKEGKIYYKKFSVFEKKNKTIFLGKILDFKIKISFQEN